MANIFGIPVTGKNDSSIWNNDAGNAVPSTAGTANGFVGSFMDPFGSVAGLWNDLTGVTEQSRSFNQQEHMLDREQQFALDYSSKMDAMAKAGINPLTAAAGLAGQSSNPNAPTAPSASGAAASGLSSLAQSGSSLSQAGLNLSQGKKNLAEAEQAQAVARNADRLADAEILSKAGTFAQALTSAGLPEIMAMEFGLNAVRNGLDGLGAYLQGIGVCRKIDKEMDILDADYDLTMKDFEYRESQIKLNTAQVSELEVRAQLENIQREKTAYESQIEQRRVALWDRYNSDPYFDQYQRLYDLYKQYGEDSSEFQGFLNAVKELYYSQGVGLYNADPAQEEYRNMYEARNNIHGLMSQVSQQLQELTSAYIDGKISLDNYKKEKKRLGDFYRELSSAYDNANELWHNQDYMQGYHTRWQDMLNGLVGYGIPLMGAAAIRRAGK